jgi:hypothetical protein
MLTGTTFETWKIQFKHKNRSTQHRNICKKWHLIAYKCKNGRNTQLKWLHELQNSINYQMIMKDNFFSIDETTCAQLQLVGKGLTLSIHTCRDNL